jgi:ABC-type Fe3+-hydroxamate transport system substrate-binding protein
MPSQTELLFDLGLADKIVGLTRFCIHPADLVSGKEKIGGTKNFNIDKIRALKPDLIIGNKEENYEEGITALSREFMVWMSDIVTMDDAYEMIASIGDMTGTQSTARAMISEIRTGFGTQPPVGKKHSGVTAAYFIWRKPYMVAASGTFINSMMETLGVQNVFAHLERYPEVSIEQVAAARPDIIFLSTEPYAFSEMHFGEFQEMCPSTLVMMADGELFSWYGSRMRLAVTYFSRLRSQIGL